MSKRIINVNKFHHYRLISTAIQYCICVSNYAEFNPCHAEYIKMAHPLLIFSQSDYLIQIVDINSNTEWQTVQIQIGWLLQKPTDLDLHCLQKQGISAFSMTRVKREFNISMRLFHRQLLQISLIGKQ